MAAPLFFSYSWSNSAEADVLDNELRYRGVPVWRDRRAMEWGGYNETLVRQVIAEDCSGFALYLTHEALHGGSGFISKVELEGMDKRRAGDPDFFAGAVFAGYAIKEGVDEIRKLSGVSLGANLGSEIDAAADLQPQLREAARAILDKYVASQLGRGHQPTIFFDTREEIPWRDERDIHLSWAPPLDSAVDDVEPDVWDHDLQPALRDLHDSLRKARTETDLIVSGQPHLSAALAFGHTFRTPGPWTLDLRPYNGNWRAERCGGDLGGWRSTPRPDDPNGDVLVACVHATHNIRAVVRNSRRNEPAPRATLDITPPGDPSTTSLDPTTSNELAAAVARAIIDARAEYGAAETHLYLACPWAFAAQIGYHLASAGPIVSFEATEARDDYRRACRLT